MRKGRRWIKLGVRVKYSDTNEEDDSKVTLEKIYINNPAERVTDSCDKSLAACSMKRR